MEKLRVEAGGLTSPAGPNHERGLPSGWVDETIVVDEGGVERDAICIECDRGELEIQSIVVPLVIADLGTGGQEALGYCIPRKEPQALAHLLGGRRQSFIFPGLSTGLASELLPTQLKESLPRMDQAQPHT